MINKYFTSTDQGAQVVQLIIDGAKDGSLDGLCLALSQVEGCGKGASMSLSFTIKEGWFLGVSLFPEHKGWWGDFLSFADFQEYRDQVKLHTVNLEQKEGEKEVPVRAEMKVRQGSCAYRNSKSPKWYLKCSEMQRTLEQAPWNKSSRLVILHHSQSTCLPQGHTG